MALQDLDEGCIYKKLICEMYPLVKSPNKFQVGGSSSGYLLSQWYGLYCIPGEKAATLLLSYVPEKPHIA